MLSVLSSSLQVCDFGLPFGNSKKHVFVSCSFCAVYLDVRRQLPFEFPITFLVALPAAFLFWFEGRGCEWVAVVFCAVIMVRPHAYAKGIGT